VDTSAVCGAAMSVQPQLLQIALDPRDVFYTPDWVARDMVEHFKPTGRVLEPCKGAGAFMQYLPTADWCEIAEGRDFFTWAEHVDWIIGNPPYSIFGKWLRHSLEIAEHVCYLIPIAKVYSVEARMRDIYQWGGIVETVYYGKGSELGFPFGFPCGAVYARKGYKGGITMVFDKQVVPL
jgi:hypothetical protein